jgi:hypothetical protein
VALCVQSGANPFSVSSGDERPVESPYHPSTEAQIEAVAARELALASEDSRTYVMTLPASASAAAGPPPLLYVLGDSLSIDYGPALEAALRGCLSYSRKNLRSAKGYCRAWMAEIGEGARGAVYMHARQWPLAITTRPPG